MHWIKLTPSIGHNLVPVPKLGTSTNCQQLPQCLHIWKQHFWKIRYWSNQFSFFTYGS